MAPEQARDEAIDHRADVYSMGVCLYEATTGRLPFSGQNDVQRLMQMVAGQCPRPSELVPGYPPRLEQIVLSAMHVDVNKRTESAQALHDALEDFIVEGRYQATHTSVALKVTQLFPKGDVAPGSVGGRGTPTSAPRFAPDAYRSPSNSYSSAGRAAALGGPRLGESVDVDLRTGASSVPFEVTGRKASSALARRPVLAVLLSIVAILVLVSAAALVMARGLPQPAPSPLPRPIDARDVKVQHILDGAERMLRERRFSAAAAVLSEVRAQPATDPDLNQRVAVLLDAAEVEVALERARTLLSASDFDGAEKLANVAIARDPDNREALLVAAQAHERKAAAGLGATEARRAPTASVLPQPAAAPSPRPPSAPKREPVPQTSGFDSEGLLPSDPDALLPPTKN